MKKHHLHSSVNVQYPYSICPVSIQVLNELLQQLKDSHFVSFLGSEDMLSTGLSNWSGGVWVLLRKTCVHGCGV